MSGIVCVGMRASAHSRFISLSHIELFLYLLVFFPPTGSAFSSFPPASGGVGGNASAAPLTAGAGTFLPPPVALQLPPTDTVGAAPAGMYSTCACVFIHVFVSALHVHVFGMLICVLVRAVHVLVHV